MKQTARPSYVTANAPIIRSSVMSWSDASSCVTVVQLGLCAIGALIKQERGNPDVCVCAAAPTDESTGGKSNIKLNKSKPPGKVCKHESSVPAMLSIK